MKERKLKSYVLPALYVVIIGAIFLGVSFLGVVLEESKVNYEDLSVSVIDDNVQAVIKDEEPKKIAMPFSSDKVNVSKSFYDMNDDEEKQQNSLMYYEKTYLQSSGILYTSEEEFDVLATLDGTVTNVSSDEILGNYVEITHNPNLKTVYYSLKYISVKKDDQVAVGQTLGTSGDNLLEKSDNCLLFEVYHNGFVIDPEDFYNMSLDDLN